MKILGPWGLLLVGILGAGCSAEMLRFGTQDRLEIHVTPPPGFNGTAVQAPQTPEGSAVPRLILPGAATLTAELKAINGPFQQLKTYNLTPAGVTVSFEEVPVGNYTLEMQARDNAGNLMGQANRKLELNSTNPPPTEIGLVPPYSGDIFVAGGPVFKTIAGLDSSLLSAGKSITIAISNGGLRNGRLSLNISAGQSLFDVYLQNNLGKPIFSYNNETNWLITTMVSADEMSFLTIYNPNPNSITILGKINVDQNFVCFDGGTGASGDPYLISDDWGLKRVATMCNPSDETAGKYFQLSQNIDLGNYTTWSPIGTGSYSFAGTFDGKDFTIFNFKPSFTGPQAAQGLFGYSSGTIKNLILRNAAMTSNFSQNGLVVGYMNGGSLENIQVIDSHISGGDRTGAILGYGNGAPGFSITNCQVTNTIVQNSGSRLGGLVGSIDATGPVNISNCFTKGTVSSTGEQVGGLVGLFNNSGTISASYSTAEVTGGVHYIGGLVGYAINGTISRCYSTGQVSGPKETGGFVGLINNTKIDSCFSKSPVIGIKNSDPNSPYRIGGFTGASYGLQSRITNCYCFSTLSHSSGSTPTEFGGFIGLIQSNDIFNFCFAAMDTKGIDLYSGFSNGSSATITNSYYDVDLNANSDQGDYKKTNTELKTTTTFSEWNPNGSTTWTFNAGSYPRLAWETP